MERIDLFFPKGSILLRVVVFCVVLFYVLRVSFAHCVLCWLALFCLGLGVLGLFSWFLCDFRVCV